MARYRTVAPPVAARARTGGTLTRRLALWLDFRAGGGALFPNLPGTPDWGMGRVGALNWVQSRGGAALQSDGSTGYLNISDIRPFFNQSAVTQWVLFDTQWNTGAYGFCGVRVGFLFYILQLFGTTIEVQQTIGGVTQNLNFSVSGEPAGLHQVAETYDGTTGTSWYDGKQKVSVGGGGGLYSIGGGAIPWQVLSDGSSGNLCTEKVLATGLWNRVLMPSELQLLAVNPWAIYDSPSFRRAAATAGAPTFSASVFAGFGPGSLLVARKQSANSTLEPAGLWLPDSASKGSLGAVNPPLGAAVQEAGKKGSAGTATPSTGAAVQEVGKKGSVGAARPSAGATSVQIGVKKAVAAFTAPTSLTVQTVQVLAFSAAASFCAGFARVSSATKTATTTALMVAGVSERETSVKTSLGSARSALGATAVEVGKKASANSARSASGTSATSTGRKSALGSVRAALAAIVRTGAAILGLSPRVLTGATTMDATLAGTTALAANIEGSTTLDD